MACMLHICTGWRGVAQCSKQLEERRGYYRLLSRCVACWTTPLPMTLSDLQGRFKITHVTKKAANKLNRVRNSEWRIPRSGWPSRKCHDIWSIDTIVSSLICVYTLCSKKTCDHVFFLMISWSRTVRLQRFLAYLLLRVQAIDRRFYFPTSPISCSYFTLGNCQDLNISKN